MLFTPLEQFQIILLFSIKLFCFDFSITNLALTKFLVLAFFLVLMPIILGNLRVQKIQKNRLDEYNAEIRCPHSKEVHTFKLEGLTLTNELKYAPEFDALQFNGSRVGSSLKTESLLIRKN